MECKNKNITDILSRIFNTCNNDDCEMTCGLPDYCCTVVIAKGSIIAAGVAVLLLLLVAILLLTVIFCMKVKMNKLQRSGRLDLNEVANKTQSETDADVQPVAAAEQRSPRVEEIPMETIKETLPESNSNGKATEESANKTEDAPQSPPPLQTEERKKKREMLPGYETITEEMFLASRSKPKPSSPVNVGGYTSIDDIVNSCVDDSTKPSDHLPTAAPVLDPYSTIDDILNTTALLQGEHEPVQGAGNSQLGSSQPTLESYATLENIINEMSQPVTNAEPVIPVYSVVKKKSAGSFDLNQDSFDSEYDKTSHPIRSDASPAGKQPWDFNNPPSTDYDSIQAAYPTATVDGFPSIEVSSKNKLGDYENVTPLARQSSPPPPLPPRGEELEISQETVHEDSTLKKGDDVILDVSEVENIVFSTRESLDGMEEVQDSSAMNKDKISKVSLMEASQEIHDQERVVYEL